MSERNILDYHCPRYNELPELELYMDQVVIYMDGVIGLFYTQEEKRLSASMINNYVKQKVIMPPVRKKYTRQHLAYLIALCLLKKVFSLSEIDKLIKLQMSRFETERAYNSFVEQFESSLKSAFLNESFTQNAEQDEMRRLLQNVVQSLVNKIYVEKNIEEK